MSSKAIISVQPPAGNLPFGHHPDHVGPVLRRRPCAHRQPHLAPAEARDLEHDRSERDGDDDHRAVDAGRVERRLERGLTLRPRRSQASTPTPSVRSRMRVGGVLADRIDDVLEAELPGRLATPRRWIGEDHLDAGAARQSAVARPIGPAPSTAASLRAARAARRAACMPDGQGLDEGAAQRVDLGRQPVRHPLRHGRVLRERPPARESPWAALVGHRL